MVKPIDELIKKSENIPLSGTQLRDLTNGKANIMRYEELMGYDNIEDVLAPHGAVILLYQTEDRDFGHYATLFKDENRKDVLIFYDSLGIGLDEELKFSKYNQKNMDGKIVKHLTNLIDNSKYRVDNNKVRLQRSVTDVNTCGRYAGLRVRLRHLTNRQFNSMLKNNEHYNPDFWVSAITTDTLDLTNLNLEE